MNKTKKLSKRIYALPVLPYLDTRSGWIVGMTDEADPLFSFSAPPPQIRVEEDGTKSGSYGRTSEDAFAVREALFGVRSIQDALIFFEAYGPWQIDTHLGMGAATLRFSSLIQTRDFFQAALLSREIGSPPKGSTAEQMRDSIQNFYLWQPLRMELHFRQPPGAIVRCKDVEEATRASIFLDRMDGLPWRLCARKDCGKVFKPKSKRVQLYCDPDCAHLQSVRSYNERKRIEAAKKKNKTLRRRRTSRKAGK